MTIRNLTLDRVWMNFALFKNVTFVECKFIQVNFDWARFENVKFIGCLFQGRGPGNIETSLRNVKADNVLFDRVTFGQYVWSQYLRGTIILRNIHSSKTENTGDWIVDGNNLNVLVDKCTIKNLYAASTGTENSTVYVRDSTLVMGISGQAKATWIENSTIRGGVGYGLVSVVKNCEVQHAVAYGQGNGSKVFVVNCTFGEPGVASFEAKPEEEIGRSDIYFYGNKKIPLLSVSGGNCHVFDTAIGELNLRPLRWKDETTSIDSLNLKNVTIKKGDWSAVFIRKGNCENVTVTGSVLLEKTPDTGITVNNVTFQARPPFIYFDRAAMFQYMASDSARKDEISDEMFYRPSNANIKARKSNQPLEFDHPPVPTLEELGFVEFWRNHDPDIAGW